MANPWPTLFYIARSLVYICTYMYRVSLQILPKAQDLKVAKMSKIGQLSDMLR